MYRGNSDSWPASSNVSYRYADVPIENAAPRDHTMFAATYPQNVALIPQHRMPADRNSSLRTIVRRRGVRSAPTPTGSWDTRSPTQNAATARGDSESEAR